MWRRAKLTPRQENLRRHRPRIFHPSPYSCCLAVGRATILLLYGLASRGVIEYVYSIYNVCIRFLHQCHHRVITRCRVLLYVRPQPVEVILWRAVLHKVRPYSGGFPAVFFFRDLTILEGDGYGNVMPTCNIINSKENGVEDRIAIFLETNIIFHNNVICVSFPRKER